MFLNARFHWRDAARELLAWTFTVSLLAYLGFFLIEDLNPGFVSLYINLNWWLWLAVLTGVGTSMWPLRLTHTPKKTTRFRFMILALGLLTTGLLVLRLPDGLGNLRWLIGALAGLMVVLFGWLLNDDASTAAKSDPHDAR